MVCQTITETPAPNFIKLGGVQPKTLNGDIKMPETKDDDSDDGDIDEDFISKSLPAIREEAKLVLEKFLKRSLSQNDASPIMRHAMHGPQLEVITEDKTVVSENGTHHSPSVGAKPKKKFVQSKNGALQMRPLFERSDSYMAAAKRSVIDSIPKHGERGADGERKPQVRNKSNSVSSVDYKDNAKHSSGIKYPRRAYSQKADGATPTPISPASITMSTITTTTIDRKDSWSSRHDSSSDDDEDSFKKRKKKNVFTRAKERLRMSFRKRELNAREKHLRKESKRSSPKHLPEPHGGDAPVINIQKATPSPDKSSSSSLPVSSPSTGDILDSLTHPTPSSRGSFDKSSNGHSFEYKQSGSRDHSEGRHTPSSASPSSSKKFNVKTGMQTPTTPSPSTSKKFKVKMGSDNSKYSTRAGEGDEIKQSLWKWFKNSKLGVKRRSSKEKGSRTPTKSVEIISSLTVSDTRINQVNRVNGSTDIVRTSSLGRFEGMRIQQVLSPGSRTSSSSVGATDSHRFKHPGDVIVAHGPSGENLEKDGRDAPKRKESLREELKRTFSISKAENIVIQKKHSFKGRCTYADRENLKLDLVPCRPRPSGGEGLWSDVVPDCPSGTPDETPPVWTPFQKPHAERNKDEKDEIYDKIAEKLASIAEDYTFMPKVSSPQQQRATVTVDHPVTPPGAAGGHDAGIEKEIAYLLRDKGDTMDLVDGTTIPQEALKEIIRTMSYRKFKKVMRQYAKNNEPDIHQMAQLFHLARGAVQLVGVGGSAVTKIKDFTLNYFVDYFAGWIMQKGGWDSVIEDSDDEGGTQV